MTSEHPSQTLAGTSEVQRAIRILSVAYLYAIVVVALLLETAVKQHWLLVACRFAPPYAWLVLPVVLMVCSLRFCSKRECIISFASIMVVSVLFIDVQYYAVSSAPRKSLEVVSWNIHHGRRGAGALLEDLKGLSFDVLLTLARGLAGATAIVPGPLACIEGGDAKLVVHPSQESGDSQSVADC